MGASVLLIVLLVAISIAILVVSVLAYRNSKETQDVILNSDTVDFEPYPIQSTTSQYDRFFNTSEECFHNDLEPGKLNAKYTFVNTLERRIRTLRLTQNNYDNPSFNCSRVRVFVSDDGENFSALGGAIEQAGDGPLSELTLRRNGTNKKYIQIRCVGDGTTGEDTFWQVCRIQPS